MGYKYKVSKSKSREYAEKMDPIKNYCDANQINYSESMDSFYFTVNGEKYRISNHTVNASNKAAFDEMGNQIREFYHSDNEGYICIFASKTRLIEIHSKIISGIAIDVRGN